MHSESTAAEKPAAHSDNFDPHLAPSKLCECDGDIICLRCSCFLQPFWLNCRHSFSCHLCSGKLSKTTAVFDSCACQSKVTVCWTWSRKTKCMHLKNLWDTMTLWHDCGGAVRDAHAAVAVHWDQCNILMTTHKVRCACIQGLNSDKSHAVA